MRDRGRGGKKKGPSVMLVTLYMNTQREFPLSVYHIIASTGKAMTMPCQQLNVLLFIYLFIQIACNGRGRVDLNQSNLKLPILILFYIYTLVIFIKDDQWLVTTKLY